MGNDSPGGVETDGVYEVSDFGKSRIEALADGIFAIAMTVLVLNLQAPALAQGMSEGEIFAKLAQLYPNFLAYIASFVTLGMFWIGHHAVFRYLKRSDRVILWLNIYYLMLVCLVPFTTGLYAGDVASRITNVVFGTNLLLMGLLTYAIWGYAWHRRYVPHDLPDAVRIFTSRRLLTSPAVVLLAILASVFQPLWAEVIYFLMVPFYMISVRLEAPKAIFRGNLFGDESSR